MATMQDQYSTMIGSQQRNDPYKDFAMNRPPTTSSMTPSTVSNPSYYHGLNYGLPTYGNPDVYGSMSMASAHSHDFAPLPAHMGTANPMSTNNGLSRINPTAHTITHTATSPQHGGDMNMSDMSSPGPSTSRVSLSPDGHSQGTVSNPSPGDVSVKQESSNSDNNSVKSNTNDDDMGIPPKKRSLSTTPEEKRDGCYWEKRKKNNESAKRSREARRMKEEQIALRVVYLEQENLQLRTEVSLLKSEIEKLRCMLYNS